jgi:hypothetical protein
MLNVPQAKKYSSEIVIHLREKDRDWFLATSLGILSVTSIWLLRATESRISGF